MASNTLKNAGESYPIETSVQSDILQMYVQKLNTDINISVGDSFVCLEAHKLILATRSSEFADMIWNDQGNSPQTIKVEGVSGRIFDFILWYMYSDELKATSPDDLMEVARTARRYGIGGLIRSCKHHLAHHPINMSSVFSMLVASKYFKTELLHEKCLQFIQSIPPNILFKEPKLLQVNLETMTSILKHRNTSSASDVIAMEGVIRWLKQHESQDRSLLSEINMFSLNCDEFMDIIEKFPNFFTSRETSRILSNMIRPGMVELPPWCRTNLQTDSNHLIPDDYKIIVANSLEIRTDCNRHFPKSYFYEEDGFEGSVVFEIKLSSCFPWFPYLVMLELAFGSSYVPRDNLGLELYTYEQGSQLKRRRIEFSLHVNKDHYYLIVNHQMRLQKNHPFVFNLKLLVSGLKKWGSDAPVSNRKYRTAKIPEDISYNMSLNVRGNKCACLTPLSDWIVLLDPECGEKKPILTSLYFYSPFNNK